ncbi:MAG: methionine biosynthesis protein MetW [Thermoleophilia bacterium]|nr:methionine biosynthesis protein MetW [Thermoleophilia bacterium]
MRPDLDIVAGLVGSGVRVLDLGCGDGALLEALIEQHGCDGLGVERDLDDFHACISRGVPVTHGDLEAELADTESGSFDCAVLSLTLQAVRHPDRVLTEMKRVAPRLIVSLPNFAYWRLRAELFFRGRMPVTLSLPYQWYDTPNIHLCTLRDFEAMAQDLGLAIDSLVPLRANGRRAPGNARLARNLLAERAVYALSA